MKFWLQKEENYIFLDQFLKAMDISKNRKHAQKIIDSGKIKINGSTEFKRRKMLKDKDIFTYKDIHVKIFSRKNIKIKHPEGNIIHGKMKRWKQVKLK